MKIKKAHVIELSIIIAILTSIIIAIILVYHNCIYKKHLYELNFEDVDGLVKGSPVKFMGIVIGHVSTLEYNNGKILAKIYITKKDVAIPMCSSAKVEFTGIVGSKYIEISPPEDENCGEEIIANNPLRLSEFFNTIQIYNRALEGLDAGLKKFSNKGVDTILTKLAKTPDFTKFDKKVMDVHTTKKYAEKSVNSAIDTEQNIGKTLDKAIERLEDINKKKKNSN